MGGVRGGQESPLVRPTNVDVPSVPHSEPYPTDTPSRGVKGDEKGQGAGVVPSCRRRRHHRRRRRCRCRRHLEIHVDIQARKLLLEVFLRFQGAWWEIFENGDRGSTQDFAADVVSIVGSLPRKNDQFSRNAHFLKMDMSQICLLYTSDAADE